VFSDLNLSPVALIALREELRGDAAETLRSLSQQSIQLKLLSGDTPETVIQVCRALAIPDGAAASGAELEQSAQRAELIERTTIFGRVTPQQKVEIVTTLQSRGQHVSMLGDGVNDVLAIKKADLGLAMGSGSQAAQAVAGLVLKEDHFDLLPAALDEGRRVIASLLQAARLFFLKNLYMLILFLGTLLVLQLKFPVVPQQVTLLNALTIAVPTLIIVATRPAPGTVFGRWLLRETVIFVLTRGMCIGLGGLAILWLAVHVRGYVQAPMQRTLLVTMLIIHGLAVVAQLALGLSGTSRQRSLLLAWPLIALGLYVGVMASPSSAYFFELQSLEFIDWNLAIGVAAVSLAFATALERRLT
jgi:cation-transporting P-type ATPase E